MPFSITEIKLIVLGVLAFFLIASTAYVTHRVDNAAYEKLELSYQKASQKAVEAALAQQQLEDQLKIAQASEAASHQQAITKQTQDKLDEVTKVLANAKSHCITNGIIQLLNASISDPTEKLPTASRQPSDACTTTSNDTILRTLIRNNGIALSNAKQLNDLIKSVKQLNH